MKQSYKKAGKQVITPLIPVAHPNWSVKGHFRYVT